jgi:transcriptional regulator with XRE-family HTH domain
MASKKKATETQGQRIARIRRMRGITQVELARTLGIRQPNLSDYERDVYRPNSDFIVRLAGALNVSTDELLGHKVKKPAQPGLSRRLAKRMVLIESLPARDQQAIIRTIDTFIRGAAS